MGSKDYVFGRIIYGGAGSGNNRPDAAIREFLGAQGIQDPIEVDTTWLWVGHVDEVVSFVPAYTLKGFKMLVASFDTAKAILEGLQSEGKGYLTLFEGKVDWRGYPAERTIDEILTDASLIAFNQQKQAQIDAVRSKLVTELGLTYPEDIVLIPVLFEPYINRESGIPTTFAEAYSPNMVNLLSVGNYYLMIPKPFGPNDSGTDKFEEYISNALNPLGLAPHFIDDWTWYHILCGEVHCGTNARRAADLDNHWWEQQ